MDSHLFTNGRVRLGPFWPRVVVAAVVVTLMSLIAFLWLTRGPISEGFAYPM